MVRKFVEFARAEDGAITVDWVLLTAMLMALGIMATSIVAGGTTDLSDKVDTALQARDPGL